MKYGICIFSLCFAAALSARQDRAYSFEQFRAPVTFHGIPARPKLATRWERTFRTVIREGAREPVNFAGHFRIVTWGCGAACESFVIVDELNGQIVDPPFRAISMLDGNLKDIFTGLDYKANSSLLIASGCPGEKECGTRYYQWNGAELIPLHTDPGLPKP